MRPEARLTQCAEQMGCDPNLFDVIMKIQGEGIVNLLNQSGGIEQFVQPIGCWIIGPWFSAPTTHRGSVPRKRITAQR